MPDSATEQPVDPVVAVATAALLEITGQETVGPLVGVEPVEDGVLNVIFPCALAGYPGWRWTVSVATVEADAPSVLELDLLPGEGALVAPEWVPWANRLADYQAGRVQDDDDVDDDDDEDVIDLDELDDDLEDLDDIDGVDFESPEDAEDEDEESPEDADSEDVEPEDVQWKDGDPASAGTRGYGEPGRDGR